MELWAGVECTVNRVGDRWFDQLERTGHAHRLDDLDRLAGLGARAVRYPVLWERTAPDGLARARWEFADERLARLRDLGVRPIVGLLHHGSGPKDTSLVDDAFPEKLAVYARAVAERYPWVDDWTPINEPLTTARFSGLYGHWYPHGRTSAIFARALLRQCLGIAAAMRAIRSVNPRARLIHTEDIGTIFSTPELAHQAAYENERRWLSLDLAFGRVTPAHPAWAHLVELGIAERELHAMVERHVDPDVVGVNYYVTSDRFLDHRLSRHDPETHGGNGRERYADVAAARVGGILGHERRLVEAWERYRAPVALTEVHLGCTREEQLRWLHDAWRGALAARARGADVRAVTLWSAFGAVDWDSLVRLERNHYEPGAWDVRGAKPRETALASLARGLASGADMTHPILVQPGWWRVVGGRSRAKGTAPLVITGARSAAARAFARACAARGIRYRLVFDLDERLIQTFDALQPWAVVDAASFREVGDEVLERARACAERGIRFVTFSTDLVFAGARRAPYVESDVPRPEDEYGATKSAVERAVRAIDPTALVVRTGRPLAGEGTPFAHLLRRLAVGDHVEIANDGLRSSTYVPDLVERALDLLLDRETGVFHAVNGGSTSFPNLVRRAARACGVGCATVVARESEGTYRALATERDLHMPTLDDALDRLGRSFAA
jgi:dTDP-4-dehydrorhamnose reductase